MTPANHILLGVLVALSSVAALFFLRYWRSTGDRLFVFFAAAFGLLGVNWGAVAALAPTEETRHWFHLIRLVAFVLIVVAIVDKNRHSK